MDLEEKINDLLSRGVATLVDPNGKLKEKLLKKTKGEDVGEIIIKFGVDPTRPDLHLGHAVVLQKLRKFQEIGCKVVFLVGDFTASIGDPTGKSKVRPEIEQKEVEENMETYMNQVGKILLTDPNVFSWIRNSDWFYTITDLAGEGTFITKATTYENSRMQKTHLGKTKIQGITLQGLIWTLKHITYSQLIERDMFQDRIKEGRPLYMHEMLYPVLQGVDSFALYNIYGDCSLEIGGTDQTFNMLMGREVMKANKQPEQAVMSLEILVGTDGKEKMSKSLDNYIGITEEPNNIFGKIMSIPDSSILNYYKLCTSADMLRLKDLENKLKSFDTNPRDIKLDLAEEVVAIYHGAKAATSAREAFVSTFQKKEIPDDVEEIKMKAGELFSDLLLRAKIVASKSEWRRLVDEGAVKKLEEGGGEEKISNATEVAVPGVYKIGKRRFIKVN
ncbi:MAG: tyrosine--tRNA ligase [Candidatus Paceibacterota bacterium]|jgi:tyrosyl-tRNA synthetase